MARPRRIYVDKKTRKLYYKINNKRKHIINKNNLSAKQLTHINIKILNPGAKRIKPKRKKPTVVFGKKINSQMQTYPNNLGLPLHQFAPKLVDHPDDRDYRETKDKFLQKLLDKL